MVPGSLSLKLKVHVIPYMNSHILLVTVVADKKGSEKLVIDKSAHQGDGVVLSKKSGSLAVG